MSALAGLRVLDLSRLLPGGFCSLLLADFGADVIKIEDTGAGDYARADEASFASLNRGKRSVQLDLKSAGGVEAFLRLASGADVVLESFRPGVMDRLGVGWSVLRSVRPSLVYCAITGYGQDGPLAGRAGHDLNYLARAGVLALSGDADGPPVQASAQIADVAGGALMAAFGILAALHSGTGQFVDISMTDGALSLLAMPAAGLLAGGPPPRRGDIPLGGRLLCYRPYRCADGWVSMGALEPKFWASFCLGVGREDLLGAQFDRPGSRAHRVVEQLMLSRTRAEWEAFNAEHDCCLEPVLELDEALASSQVRARGMVAGALLGNPVRLSETPADPTRGPAPGLGEHTDAVLTEAGYTAAEIAALRAAGAAK
jgi:crotonobetainyl-CoA:carnitine CoA-transferase CaiB-like acyl-CoA transferase